MGTSTNRARPLVLLVSVAALNIAGISACGDSDSTEASLTKKQFVQRAEEICNHAEGEQLQLATVYIKKRPGTGSEELVKVAGVPPLEKEVHELELLSVPQGDEKRLQIITEEFTKALDVVRNSPQAALSQQQSNPFERANALSKAYGLKVCSNAP
jgi:hypothetical protein